MGTNKDAEPASLHTGNATGLTMARMPLRVELEAAVVVVVGAATAATEALGGVNQATAPSSTMQAVTHAAERRHQRPGRLMDERPVWWSA
jgi:hypothetical protein